MHDRSIYFKNNKLLKYIKYIKHKIYRNIYEKEYIYSILYML